MKNYSRDDVLRLRKKRRKRKAHKESNLKDDQFVRQMGDLRAAGHIKPTTKSPFSVKKDSDGNVIGIDVWYNLRKYEGDRPHFEGYIRSASNLDEEPYKVKIWINKNGTMRIEAVSPNFV